MFPIFSKKKYLYFNCILENGNKIISNNATLTYRQTQNIFISGKKWCEAERHEGVKKIMMNEIENMEKNYIRFL